MEQMYVKGTWIKCQDEEKLKRKLKELSDQGYGAVRTGYSSLIICITSVPVLEDEE